MTTLFSGFVKEHDLEVNSMLSCLVAALFFYETLLPGLQR